MQNRLLALLVALLLVPMAARAATINCVATGTAASPTTWSTGAAWSGGVAPGVGDKAILSAACHIIIPIATSVTVQEVLISSASASLDVNGSLTVSQCDTVDQRAGSGTVTCGASAAGSFHATGTLLYDSRTSSMGNLWSSTTAIVTARNQLQINLPDTAATQAWLASLPGGDVAAGDILMVKSGPQSGAPYKVMTSNTAGCDGVGGGNCNIQVFMYDSTADPAGGTAPDALTHMGYTAASTSQTGMIYADTTATCATSGTCGQSRPFRIASPQNSQFVSKHLDRCVTVCDNNSDANDGTCNPAAGTPETSTNAVKVSGDLVGNYLAFTSGSQAKPGDLANMGNHRYLITETYNDQNAANWINGDTGTVDVICVAEPITSDWAGSTTTQGRAGGVWPGFSSSDQWILYRPAVISYSGTEGDGALAFYNADFAANMAVFRFFVVIHTSGGTAASQQPFTDTVVVPWQKGSNASISNHAAAAGCNREAVTIGGYTNAVFDGLAIVDSRTAADTSASCCIDKTLCAAPGAGHGSNICETGDTACAAGAGVLYDGDTAGGHHGIAMWSSSTNFTDRNGYSRYLGDDAVVFGNNTGTYTFDNHTFFRSEVGTSNNAVDASVMSTGGTVNLRNSRIYNWGSDTACNPSAVIASAGTTTVINAVNNFILDSWGMFPAISARAASLITGNVLIGRDMVAASAPTDCGTFQAGGAPSMVIRNNFIDGWTTLDDSGVNATAIQYNVHVASTNEGTEAANPLLSTMASGTNLVVSDNVLLNQPNDNGAGAAAATVLVTVINAAGGSTNRLTVKDNYLQWEPQAARSTAQGDALGSFTNAESTTLADVSGNAIANKTLLNCADATWGTANQAAIGKNAILDPYNGTVIGSGSTNCASSDDRQYVATAGTYQLNLGGVLSGQFGPKHVAGVPASSRIYTDLDIQRPIWTVVPNGRSGAMTHSSITRP